MSHLSDFRVLRNLFVSESLTDKSLSYYLRVIDLRVLKS